METKSIKETKELLAGLGEVAVAAKKIAKDGKVSADDLTVLMDLALKAEKLSAAVQGVGEVPAELKDLDEAEVMEIIKEIYAISEKINLV